MSEPTGESRLGDGRLDTGDVRRFVATLLVVLGSVLALVGGVALYARQEIFSADNFAQRASVSLRNGDVRSEISDQIVDQIIEQGSGELIQAKPLLEAVVSNVLDSAPFRSIFRKAVVQVHRAVFSRDEGSIVLDLADTGQVVVGAAKALAPGVARRIPRDVEPGLVEISDRSFATDTLRVADDVRFLGIVLPVLALVCFAGAFAVGRDRRRTAVNLGTGLAVAGAVGVMSYYVGRVILLGHFDDERRRRAVAAVWDAFLVDLRTWCLIVGAGGIIIAAAASTYLQHVDVTDEASGLRHRLLARPKGRLAQLGRALAIAALSLFVVLEPSYTVQIAVVVLGAYGLYYAVGELLRIYQPAARRAGTGAPTARAGLRSYGQRAALVGAAVLAVVIAGVVVVLAGRGGGEPQRARANVPIAQCNGYAALCNRPLNEVSFPATHNSMAAAGERGWYFPAQRGTIGTQLRNGVRGLLIDTHYGVPDGRGHVRTNLDREGTTRAKVVSEIGGRGFAAAQRLVGRIGFGELKGKDDLYLCHTLCEIGATKLVTGLRQLKDFLDDYPNEVVMVFIQDAISPQSTAQAFREAGLESRLYVHARNDDWPTLRQMIRSGRRVFVLAEETTTGGPPWYHQGFDLVQETPYTFTSLQELEAPSSCRLNRGTPNSPLFQLNHWIERVNPSPALARRVNSPRVLLRRAQRCERIRGLLPNLVNVDFYDEGDVFGAVRVLNGLPRTARPTYLRSR